MHLSVHGSIEINLQINRDIYLSYPNSHSHASNYEPNFPLLLASPKPKCILPMFGASPKCTDKIHFGLGDANKRGKLGS